MFDAFGQHQHLVPLLEGARDLVCYCRGAAGIAGDMPEHILDGGVGGKVNASGQVAGNHPQGLRRASRSQGRVSGRPALHEDDRLPPITPDWCRGEPEHVSGFGPLQDGLERKRREVVALVGNDLTVVLDNLAGLTLPGQRLHQRDVDLAAWLGLAASNGADHTLTDAQEGLQSLLPLLEQLGAMY